MDSTKIVMDSEIIILTFVFLLVKLPQPHNIAPGLEQQNLVISFFMVLPTDSYRYQLEFILIKEIPVKKKTKKLDYSLETLIPVIKSSSQLAWSSRKKNNI